MLERTEQQHAPDGVRGRRIVSSEDVSRKARRQRRQYQQLTGRPFARVTSSTSTGRGSLFTHMEQQFRPGGATRGKKQHHRFPRTDNLAATMLVNWPRGSIMGGR